MPRQGILASWEDIRNTKEVHWAMECFAEMVRFDISTPSIWLSIGQLGVFIFVYFGKSSWARTLSVSLSSTTKASGPKQVGSLETLSKYQGSLVCPATNMICASDDCLRSYSPDRSRLFIRNLFWHQCLCCNIRGSPQPLRYHRLLCFQEVPCG